jgi:two-component system phosphate regulon sensor histidine kinase PhoR
VDIASQVTENSYVITIKDTGLGISSEDQNHIFERFYRADKSRNQQIPGTGLGLAIVNDLVLSIGGNIDLTSQRGVGTTIQLTFPISVLNE